MQKKKMESLLIFWRLVRKTVFASKERHFYFKSKNVPMEELQKLIDDGLTEVLEKDRDTPDLIEEAIDKGIANYSEMTKEELIEALWNNAETMEVDTAKLNRIKARNCNKKRRARQEAIAELSEAGR